MVKKKTPTMEKAETVDNRSYSLSWAVSRDSLSKPPGNSKPKKEYASETSSI